MRRVWDQESSISKPRWIHSPEQCLPLSALLSARQGFSNYPKREVKAQVPRSKVYRPRQCLRYLHLPRRWYRKVTLHIRRTESAALRDTNPFIALALPRLSGSVDLPRGPDTPIEEYRPQS